MDWDSLMDCQGAQSQKEGQEDKGTLKQLRGVPQQLCPPDLLSGSGLPGNPSSYLNFSSYPYVEACPGPGP